MSEEPIMPEMLPFVPGNAHKDDPIYNNEEIPDELNIFFRDESSFLPDGKTFDDLTEAEKKTLRQQYRFSPYRPGMYQTLTKMGMML